MPLKRTTTRALAASVAMVAAGGTVAGAAVFHIPVLGFAAANNAPTEFVRAAAVNVSATRIAPIRVVKTRYVDQIVHHRGAWSAAAAATTTPTFAAQAQAATPADTVAPVRHEHESDDPPETNPPVAEPPGTPVSGGDDSHETDLNDGQEDHGGHSGGDE